MKAQIPLPTQSYWGNLQVGKPVQKTPLPDSAETKVSAEFSYRKKPVGLGTLISEKAVPPVIEPPAPEIKPDLVKKDPQGERNIYGRDTLYREVWEQPVSKVALKNGVSDVMIHKYDYVPTGKLRVAAYGESFIRDSSTAGVEERILFPSLSAFSQVPVNYFLK